jgi:hypothetical protein
MVHYLKAVRNAGTRIIKQPFSSACFSSIIRSIGIADGYGLDDRGVGVRVPVTSKLFSSPRPPDRLWGPSSLLYNACRGQYPRRQSGRGLKFTTHLQVVSRSRKCGSIHPLPHTPSWCSVQLVKHRDNFTVYLYLLYSPLCLPMLLLAQGLNCNIYFGVLSSAVYFYCPLTIIMFVRSFLFKN